MSSGPAHPPDEACIRCVEVQESQQFAALVRFESVPSSDGRRHEGTRDEPLGLRSDDDGRLAFEDVERVDVVLVGVRVDSLPAALEHELDHRELRQLAFDQALAVFALERLALARPAKDRLVERPAAVRRRIVLVKALSATTANVVSEAHARRMEVEEDRGVVARVAEGVDDPRRRGCVRPRPAAGPRHVGPEPDLQLPLEHVEGVGVLPVDVRVGAFLAGLVAEPRDDQLLELGEDAQRPLGSVDDGLALAGA